MTTPTQNKRAGARWESQFRDEMRRHGFKYEQLRLTGTNDEGDGYVTFDDDQGGYALCELKAGAMHPADFVGQAIKERNTFAERRGIHPDDVQALAIIKARGKPWHQAYVLTTVEDYFGIVV